MHRLIVAILAAVDALIAVAVGLAVVLAPLTLLWVIGFGNAADWNALWPVSATIWQFGHVVPLDVTLPGDYLAETGIDASSATFVLSLAPLAFTAFTAIFAARSGRRASGAGAWVTGVVVGTAVFVALTTLTVLTGHVALAEVETWQAVLFPSLVFAVPALVGAIASEWSDAGDGLIARVRDRVEEIPGWGAVPGLIARGTAVVVVGLVGLGALATAIALVMGGGQVIALFEAAQVDAFGATVMTIAQLAYLPTIIVWAMSFIAGPGFAIGTDTVVGPAGTHVGILPGIPVLGAVPESTTTWLLLLALLPVALGAFAGWIARSRIAVAQHGDVVDGGHDPVGPRLAIGAGIAVCSASLAALLAALASGSMGPGALSHAGPAPGAFALAVGLETALGAGVLLLSPRPGMRRAGDAAAGAAGSGSWSSGMSDSSADSAGGSADSGSGEAVTEPLDRLPAAPSVD